MFFTIQFVQTAFLHNSTLVSEEINSEAMKYLETAKIPYTLRPLLLKTMDLGDERRIECALIFR
ncbi:hypothetical protein HAX54_012824, partial [Datura stramonium]|nr:hypothetical protein [Datura stramonium]